MSTPFRVRSRAASPLQRTVAAATSALLALTGAVALGAGPLATPAAAQLPMCPAPGEMPGIGNVPEFTDSNIAVYAGGNYSATGTAAESEGLLVVMGDALFDKAGGGIYNVGSVGVGSQITPPGGTTMLAVGGNLVVGPVTTMEVGAQVAGGGNVDVGGTITNTVPLQLNGGTATAGMGAAAVAPHVDFQDVITEQSRILGGAAGTSGTIEPWGELRFAGDPTDELHTFTVDGAALSSLDRKMSVYFDGVGDSAPIVVNVTGSVVDFDTQSVVLDGIVANSLGSPEFGNAASRILWNFVDATSLEIGENDQFLGSILAPHADTTLKTSTNGRVYVGKDLAVIGTGGIEQHNYPWIGPGPFDCRDASGATFSVAKGLTGSGSTAVPAGTTFEVDYSYVLDGTTVTGTLEVLADGTPVAGPQGLPEGTVVTLSEPRIPEVAGISWGTPTFEPRSPITLGEGGTVAVRLTNTANLVEAPAGGFSVAKELLGSAAGLVPEGTEFTVAYTYELDGQPQRGTLKVLADGTFVDGPQDLPVGTVVTFAEVDLPEIPDLIWDAPVFSPASITVAQGVNSQVSLTNSAAPAVLAVGGFFVSKAVVGGAAGKVPADTEFTVSYSYELAGEPTSGTLTVLADGTVVDGPQNLLVGTVVTFSEVDLPSIDGVVWGAPVFSPASVTIGDDTNTEVTLTNTATEAPAGGFSVQKAVTGEASGLVPSGTELTVSYSYELDGVPTTGTLTVLADGTVVDGPQNLPVGTVVTFSEVDLPSIDGVVWGAPVFSPASVTIEDGVTAEVTLTNTATDEPAGGFSVRKVVEGSASGAVPAGTELTVAYSYELDGVATSGTATVLADGTLVDGPQNLPVGTVVTFGEIDLPSIDGVVWGAPAFSPASVTVEGGTSAVVTVTNTADVVAAQVGTFSIVKKIEGPNTSKVPADTEFTVTFSGTVNGEHQEGALTVRADGTVVDGPANLPTGTVVDLEETSLPKVDGVSWGTPVFTVDGEKVSSITIGAGQVVEVTLTNTAGSGLAVTGTGALGIAAAALLLVGGGAVLLVGARRRRA
ncbi:DUF5979 domain-containing protein [Oerskovia sp. NPDC060287]|uniref:DUF5979 domain-containing protein n=1 Tax=Oerskovia sp. NPDC060287 TaxID=3347095 RepID=UPI00365972A7